MAKSAYKILPFFLLLLTQYFYGEDFESNGRFSLYKLGNDIYLKTHISGETQKLYFSENKKQNQSHVFLGKNHIFLWDNFNHSIYIYNFKNELREKIDLPLSGNYNIFVNKSNDNILAENIFKRELMIYDENFSPVQNISYYPKQKILSFFGKNNQILMIAKNSFLIFNTRDQEKQRFTFDFKDDNIKRIIISDKYLILNFFSYMELYMVKQKQYLELLARKSINKNIDFDLNDEKIYFFNEINNVISEKSIEELINE